MRPPLAENGGWPRSASNRKPARPAHSVVPAVAAQRINQAISAFHLMRGAVAPGVAARDRSSHTMHPSPVQRIIQPKKSMARTCVFKSYARPASASGAISEFQRPDWCDGNGGARTPDPDVEGGGTDGVADGCSADGGCRPHARRRCLADVRCGKRPIGHSVGPTTDPGLRWRTGERKGLRIIQFERLETPSGVARALKRPYAPHRRSCRAADDERCGIQASAFTGVATWTRWPSKPAWAAIPSGRNGYAEGDVSGVEVGVTQRAERAWRRRTGLARPSRRSGHRADVWKVFVR